MSLRIIEVVVNKSLGERARLLLDPTGPIDLWQQQLADERVLVRALVATEKSEAILDQLSGSYEGTEGFRVVLLPVEATLPRPTATAQPDSVVGEAPEAVVLPAPRVSREELRAELEPGASVSTVFIVMTLLSAVVAAIGLIRDNATIVIGAMVIAPLLGPNMALALGTTLGDLKLARTSVWTNALGIALVLMVAVLVGMVIPVDPHVREIASRTQVGLGDIVLALAAGVAGALAFTTGAPATLIGVMVAVALVPPLVTFGLLVSAGCYEMALRALLLTMVNVICVNLAGVSTFILQGIHPRAWWDTDRARRATRVAVSLWGTLLILLTGLIWLSRSVCEGQFCR